MSDLQILSLDVEEDPEITPLKSWQLRRDLVITAAHNSGASPELLAQVFDLDPRRIKQIVVRTGKRYEASPNPNRADCQCGVSRRFVA